MHAWFLGGMLVAAWLVIAVPSASAQDVCDGMLNCHVENAPPNCGGGWYGSEDAEVGPVSVTVNYCKYWGPEP